MKIPTTNPNKEIKKVALKAGISETDAQDVFQMIKNFYQEVENRGGIEKYMHSNLSWLKIELTLLNKCYQLAASCGMKVMDISEMLSLNDLNIFPKTPSQLQNTYYKLKKNIISFEDIPKNKPGRKRKSEKNATKEKRNIFGQVVTGIPSDATLKGKKNFDKNAEKNLIDLLSGMKSNVQLLSERDGDYSSVYNLLKSIYSLSSLTIQKDELDRKYQRLQNKTQELEKENFYLRQQNETMTVEFQKLVSLIAKFVFTSEMDQISALPIFTQESIVSLNKLGVFKENYEEM
ncbi:motility gene repressor mogR [Listeria fleischmannii subsp. fleischmannii LU2006-1]|nr:motility gene repressor mogR [Listeria fleischmannii subsp. fleischmannii LU2006-1]